MKRIALVGNGDFIPCQVQLQTYDVVIALDGGFNHCKVLAIKPDYVLGDGDSITNPPDDFIHDQSQTITDLQKGLNFVQKTFGHEVKIDLFCVTSGERLDHTLNAIYLLTQYKQIQSLFSVNEQIWFVDKSLIIKSPNKTRLSILPYGKNEVDVRISGCKWSGDFHLKSDQSGLSNKTNDENISIIIKSGCVLVSLETIWTKP
ncbi:MAG: thiamine diphosphokinase [Patescibacteria group bacterium]|jgi:thiamine pyrophosphokinase